MSETDFSTPSLRTVMAEYGIHPDKRLGQNFILDGNLTDKIVRQAGDLEDMSVVEIGPGPGGLTRSVLRAGARRVVAVEYDPRAVAALTDLAEKAQGRLQIVQADALRTDIRTLCPEPRAIIANLPYNIATPLLIGWLKLLREDPAAVNILILMVQKEVAQRIVSAPHCKTYGRLSVMCQWLCEAVPCFDVPASAFTPPPKVTSTVLRLTPRILPEESPAFDVVESLTAAAFGQRRKMLRSALKARPDIVKSLDVCGISPALRAENLSVPDFIRIAGCLH